ncbi:unnamed protein product [Protopolystoma xenopodis]|uniref:Uncharacterized protein n=1 Tax=Protopolystoma xenopodis TaxID=117903 RepID=A0A448XIV4_9PLAT|nr:unnamed protein product [Protopolystoma xenopodis]
MHLRSSPPALELNLQGNTLLTYSASAAQVRLTFMATRPQQSDRFDVASTDMTTQSSYHYQSHPNPHTHQSNRRCPLSSGSPQLLLSNLAKPSVSPYTHSARSHQNIRPSKHQCNNIKQSQPTRLNGNLFNEICPEKASSSLFSGSLNDACTKMSSTSSCEHPLSSIFTVTSSDESLNLSAQTRPMPTFGQQKTNSCLARLLTSYPHNPEPNLGSTPSTSQKTFKHPISSTVANESIHEDGTCSKMDQNLSSESPASESLRGVRFNCISCNTLNDSAPIVGLPSTSASLLDQSLGESQDFSCIMSTGNNVAALSPAILWPSPPDNLSAGNWFCPFCAAQFSISKS